MRIDQGLGVVGFSEWIEASTGLSRGIPESAEKARNDPIPGPSGV
jgi:hypothetical protein